jgi:Protein of unknown function (DUF4197)
MEFIVLTRKGVLVKSVIKILCLVALSAPVYSFAQASPQASPQAAQIMSEQNSERGLKDALVLSANNAVSKLGVVNGFFNNEKVKIPMPPAMQKVEKLLRTFGMKKQAGELVETMNHAAEQAVPEAKSLLMATIRKMTVQDATGIITGGDDAATSYFRKNTEAELAAKFLPIVTKATQNVGLAEKYNKLAKRGSKFGLVDSKDAKLEDYVTRKALDGLYLIMAEEEKNIRKNPLQATSTWIRKIFGRVEQ